MLETGGLRRCTHHCDNFEQPRWGCAFLRRLSWRVASRPLPSFRVNGFRRSRNRTSPNSTPARPDPEPIPSSIARYAAERAEASHVLTQPSPRRRPRHPLQTRRLPAEAMSKSRIATRASLALLITWGCLGAAGCQIDRSYFRMDSNSPVPFFGFDLIPRKTSAVVPEDGSVRLASHREHDARRTAADEQESKQRIIPLDLPRLTPFIDQREESVQFPEGPQETSR